MLESSKETQKTQLRQLLDTFGWKVLEYRIKEQMELLRSQLENDGGVDTIANQNQLKAFKFVLRQVEESREKSNATE